MGDVETTDETPELPEKPLEKPSKHADKKWTVQPDVPVFCSCDDFIYLDQFKPNPENPNVHPNDQVLLLADILKEGWRLAITVSNRSGLIVKGHGRWLAARRGGLRGAPVDYQDYESEEKEIQDMLADNQIAALSHRDPAKVKPLAIRLDRASVPLRLAGFRPMDLKRMFEAKEKAEPQYSIIANMNEKYDYVLVFAQSATDDAALLSLLNIEVQQSYKKTGVGMGRVITFEMFIRALVANLDMIKSLRPEDLESLKK